MRKSATKTPLLLSIVFFIISGAAFFYVYQETYKNHQESRQRESEWYSETLRRGNIRTLDNSVKAIEGERAELQTHFAKASDIVPFLDTIEGLAPKVGVLAEILSVNVLEDQSGLLVGLKAAGTFAGLYKFLFLLENSPYELELVSLEMERQAEVAQTKGAPPKWNGIYKIKLLSFVP